MSRVLAVRLDSLGDVLVTGPAVRALAGAAEHLTLLCGPRGRAAAELLPGVDEVLCWRAPWVDPDPEPVRPEHVEDLRAALAARRFDRAVVFTSFHQSPLPTALVLRLAGIAWVGAICEDYPGSLLDVRHRLPDDLPEPERALSLAAACGAPLPPGDDGRLAVRGVAAQAAPVPEPPYVVLHPGTSVPARAWPPDRFRETCRRLVDDGHRVVVTGAPGERGLTARVAGASGALDLGGRTNLVGLASVLAHARAVVVGNTGPAHLAAAVGTPVVSLFAPTVPAVRWAPYGVPRVLLGDQTAPCRDSRATACPVPGHPCLASVTPDDVLSAVVALSAPPVAEPA
ncbi:glycosyltransferase family 9 protein [Nocardioides sp. cx-173]|uniref:glycosyltransferase family 9 protein n=1 Tax=Nocardioides sp. cx-173 TaxID=2898796 RepID=UPI001E55351F|nr:glycosyltransferase family 9 protein [Nocardioides sp. cx-173]MCD4527373.1 glycosyltransferase family 9 protein [Nocardioides sp. cx-173]UGB42415.1 glycosyltransferase family 9 protein [Nocardioides sp. cx-173]